MKKVSASKVVMAVEAVESPLSAEVQEALGELVGAAREGLLALSVGVGLSVVHELMELEVAEVVGPKGKHNPERTAKRHGHEDGSLTLGGRRVGVCRPRIRSADDEHAGQPGNSRRISFASSRSKAASSAMRRSRSRWRRRERASWSAALITHLLWRPRSHAARCGA
jgi:hypothetical protein